MKKWIAGIWILFLVFMVAYNSSVLSASNLEVKDPSSLAPTQKASPDDSKERQFRGNPSYQEEKQVTSVSMPIYKPPLRGAPRGRVGGGTRGIGDQLVSLSVLAPDHVGLTTFEQPTLYWYISTVPHYQIELTIIEDEAIYPLAEKRLSLPLHPGIQQIRLMDLDVHIAPGFRYRWFVAVVPDPERRSKDILSGGMIERIVLPEAIRSRMHQSRSEDAPFIYAEEGIWYDTLETLSDLIAAAPDDMNLRRQRAALLEQVGLSEIAEIEKRQGVSDKK